MNSYWFRRRAEDDFLIGHNGMPPQRIDLPDILEGSVVQSDVLCSVSIFDGNERYLKISSNAGYLALCQRCHTQANKSMNYKERHKTLVCPAFGWGNGSSLKVEALSRHNITNRLIYHGARRPPKDPPTVPRTFFGVA